MQEARCLKVKSIVQAKQARVKNADLRHPSCAVVMKKRKFASPVLNVLKADSVVLRKHRCQS